MAKYRKEHMRRWVTRSLARADERRFTRRAFVLGAATATMAFDIGGSAPLSRSALSRRRCWARATR
jgi:hypothetical protein